MLSPNAALLLALALLAIRRRRARSDTIAAKRGEAKVVAVESVAQESVAHFEPTTGHHVPLSESSSVAAPGDVASKAVEIDFDVMITKGVILFGV